MKHLESRDLEPPTEYKAFVSDPLSIWIESVFGVNRQPGGQRLVRSQPRSLRGDEGAARLLCELTGVDEERCAQVIEQWLLAGYACTPDIETGSAPFAFRLHQFISPGDTAYTSLEAEETRYITVHGQQFVPGDRKRVLFPLVFCRECGQEYYSVSLSKDPETGQHRLVPREYDDHASDNQGMRGYLYLSTTHPWPNDTESMINRLPDDWLEEHQGVLRIRSNRRKDLPLPLRVRPDGSEDKTDALYFHLYGIARDDVDYIMETFPIVKRKDVAAHGEYRTKRVILEMYDQMAASGGVAGYQTWLNPPPADPSVAHEDTRS